MISVKEAKLSQVLVSIITEHIFTNKIIVLLVGPSQDYALLTCGVNKSKKSHILCLITQLN